MNIEGNKKEIEAMEQFHKGNRQDYDYKNNLLQLSGKNIKIRIIVLARRRVGIMEIVRNVLRFTEHIKNMFQIV